MAARPPVDLRGVHNLEPLHLNRDEGLFSPEKIPNFAMSVKRSLRNFLPPDLPNVNREFECGHQSVSRMETKRMVYHARMRVEVRQRMARPMFVRPNSDQEEKAKLWEIKKCQREGNRRGIRLPDFSPILAIVCRSFLNRSSRFNSGRECHMQPLVSQTSPKDAPIPDAMNTPPGRASILLYDQAQTDFGNKSSRAGSIELGGKKRKRANL